MSRSNHLRSIAEYAKGDISPDRFQELEAALREDADLRREFIEYMNIDSTLADIAALSENEATELDATETQSESAARRGDDSKSRCHAAVRIGRSHRLGAIIAVVAVSLVVTMFLCVAVPTTGDDVPRASVVAKVDATLMRSGKLWSDVQLPLGEYRLDRGLVHLQFDDRVMVYLEAPARFDVVADDRLALHRGRLSASVPPEGIGFTVETPEAEVVDFGTEFSVEAEASASEVHVFNGLVRVQPRSRKHGAQGEAIELRTSQAVKVEDGARTPIDIALARDRFIRNFDEPQRRFPATVRRLLPLAYYRMPIRDRGLVAEPIQYSGVVLTGDGVRPPHASGVVAGGSLRVMADSTGRGGRLDSPPALGTGQFTLAAHLYLESEAPGGTAATNLRGAAGNFELALDDHGRIQATIRDHDGLIATIAGSAILPIETWRHVVMTADGDRLRVYEDGRLVASTSCGPMAESRAETLWFGTDDSGSRLWNGRIDEVAIFDKALTDDEIADLHQAALAEMARTD